MNHLNIIGIAIGLSMDAFAVSVTNGMVIKNFRFRHALRMALFFGIFQAIMPILGWSAGLTFAEYIKDYDHWIAFLLLTIIGGKMIWESRELEECDFSKKNCTHLPTLIILSIATSIDALAAGLSFAMLNQPMIEPVLIIGFITFIVCLIGAKLGDRFGHLFENKVELAGGIILILIGVKILIEHLVME